MARKVGFKVALSPAPHKTESGQKFYLPHTTSNGTLSMSHLLDLMSSGGGSMSRAQTVACLTRLFEVIQEHVLLGHRVPLGDLGTLGAYATGLLDAEGRPVKTALQRRRRKTATTGRVDFAVQFTPSAKLKKALANVPYRIHKTDQRCPAVNELVDATTGQPIATITPGQHVRLLGKNLKFNPATKDEGIILALDSGKKRTWRITDVIDNTGPRLTFQIPADLPTGTTCRIYVRKRFPRCQAVHCNK